MLNRTVPCGEGVGGGGWGISSAVDPYPLPPPVRILIIFFSVFLNSIDR